jgi:hypothetical protein
MNNPMNEEHLNSSQRGSRRSSLVAALAGFVIGVIVSHLAIANWTALKDFIRQAF